MLRKVFWALVAVTAALIVLTALGWDVILPLVGMILVDVLVVEEMRRKGMKMINNDLAHTIAARFDSLEKAVTSSRDDILRAMGKEIPVAKEEVIEEKTEAPVEDSQPEEAVIEPAEIEEQKSEGVGFSVNYGGQQ